ncbi:MAG: uncharacterized protein A8A55_0325 [Amphiamblys sp. WSBS2006]|nr:MAG: uncharacterized protein A8A55_0325 [Amphiamblys sp. WSBS2006]
MNPLAGSLSLLLATSVCVLGERADHTVFAYVPKEVLPRLQTEEQEFYVFKEQTQPKKLSSVYFASTTQPRNPQTPVSLLRFVYDETEAGRFGYLTKKSAARCAKETAAWFIAECVSVDVRRKCVTVKSAAESAAFPQSKQKTFFISFGKDVSVQIVPDNIAGFFTQEKKHQATPCVHVRHEPYRDLFDNFVASDIPKSTHQTKTISVLPTKRKNLLPFLSFLVKNKIQLRAEHEIEVSDGDTRKTRIPEGLSLFLGSTYKSFLSCFSLENTRLACLAVSSIDFAQISLRNTHIEELFFHDSPAIETFYRLRNCLGETRIDTFSFKTEGSSDEKVAKTIRWVYARDPENAPQKIKQLVLKNNVSDFLEEAWRNRLGRIHVEDLFLCQDEYTPLPDTGRVFVSRKLVLRGSVFLFFAVELGPDLDHLKIHELRERCLFFFFEEQTQPKTISVQLEVDRVCIEETMFLVSFLNRKTTAARLELCTPRPEDPCQKGRIDVGRLELLVLKHRGINILPNITNKEIIVDRLEVTTHMYSAPDTEEEIKTKRFVIRKELHMTNNGVFFMKFLGRNTFIPKIRISFDACIERRHRNLEIALNQLVAVCQENSILVRTNLLVSPCLDHMENRINGIIVQRNIFVKDSSRYKKLVFSDGTDSPVCGCCLGTGTNDETTDSF